MARIRLAIVTGLRGPQAAAPTYAEVPGSYQAADPTVLTSGGIKAGIPLGDPRLAGVTVLADVPDEDVNAAKDGLDPAAIKRRYPEHFLVTSGTIK